MVEGPEIEPVTKPERPELTKRLYSSVVPKLTRILSTRIGRQRRRKDLTIVV